MQNYREYLKYLVPHTTAELKDVEQFDEDEDWAMAAIDQLGRLLRWYQIGFLVEILTENRQPSSDCITIQAKYKGGRICIRGHYVCPHEVYCRIWRWGDLQMYLELATIGSEYCQFPWRNEASDKVCINPFHYRRRVAPELPPVLVPRYSNCPYKLIGSTVRCTWKETPKVTAVGNDFPNNALLNPNNGQLIKDQSWDDLVLVPEEDLTPPEDLKPTKTDNIKAIYFPKQKPWLTIDYHEGHKINFPTLAVDKTLVFIDNMEGGAVHERQNYHRLCLQKLKRPVRKREYAQLREQIGKGLLLISILDQLYACNRCKEESIFVSSPFTNHLKRVHWSTVVEIPPGGSLVIFDNREYIKLLQDAVNDGGFPAVFALDSFAYMRIALVQGWGLQFGTNTIVHCPSWMILTLRNVRTMRNEVLRQMGLPLKSGPVNRRRL